MPLFLALLRSETAASPDRMQAALAGLRAYQDAPRPPLQLEMPVIASRRGAMLRDYGGDGPPVLFIPSLINPPNVLDLGPAKSLLRWLAAQGHRVLLLDWGSDSRSRRHLDVAAHVEEVALPLIAALDEPSALVGYCLGGTMALAAAALAPVRRLALIAAPWRFHGYPEEGRRLLTRLWIDAAPTSAALGVLPMEALQAAFWNLDPARTVTKFEHFAALAPDSPEARDFVVLEDWANDGPPIPEAAAREMFDAFFTADLPGRGEWQVGGRPIDPAAIPCPVLNIVSATDRIVPAASAPQAGERLELAQGHVGMIVGGQARTRLWEPLSDWLSQGRTG